MKFIIGKKVNMTQVFTEQGVIPATVISTSPITVTQIKTQEKDGYSAVQVGFGDRKQKNINKAQRGHFKELGNFAFVKEFKTAEQYNVGDKLDVNSIKEGDVVEVSAISKGKGFQGVVKRHDFAGGPRTHGQKHSEREPGSIGGGLRTGTRKGKRMAGRMGAERITVKNLKVVKIDTNENVIFVSGAIPGRRGTIVEIKTK
jgi:large subunit ribosomal protein L3